MCGGVARDINLRASWRRLSISSPASKVEGFSSISTNLSTRELNARVVSKQKKGRNGRAAISSHPTPPWSLSIQRGASRESDKVPSATPRPTFSVVPRKPKGETPTQETGNTSKRDRSERRRGTDRHYRAIVDGDEAHVPYPRRRVEQGPRMRVAIGNCTTIVTCPPPPQVTPPLTPDPPLHLRPS